MLDSIFTERELNDHRRDEIVYINAAKKGNPRPLFSFWSNKQFVMMERINKKYGKDGRLLNEESCLT